MHPRVLEVTERLINRSRATRDRYLQLILEAATDGPQRGKLQCANFAHGVAGCGPEDRVRPAGRLGRYPQLAGLERLAGEPSAVRADHHQLARRQDHHAQGQGQRHREHADLQRGDVADPQAPVVPLCGHWRHGVGQSVDLVAARRTPQLIDMLNHSLRQGSILHASAQENPSHVRTRSSAPPARQAAS